METRGKTRDIRISIDCPVCRTANYFRSDRFAPRLNCVDCGFILAETPPPEWDPSGGCIFCGSDLFYLEGFLPLPAFSGNSYCYVCEARYKNFRMKNAEPKFSSASCSRARSSAEAKNWEERAAEYQK